MLLSSPPSDLQLSVSHTTHSTQESLGKVKTKGISLLGMYSINLDSQSKNPADFIAKRSSTDQEVQTLLSDSTAGSHFVHHWYVNSFSDTMRPTLWAQYCQIPFPSPKIMVAVAAFWPSRSRRLPRHCTTQASFPKAPWMASVMDMKIHFVNSSSLEIHH